MELFFGEQLGAWEEGVLLFVMDRLHLHLQLERSERRSARAAGDILTRVRWEEVQIPRLLLLSADKRVPGSFWAFADKTQAIVLSR